MSLIIGMLLIVLVHLISSLFDANPDSVMLMVIIQYIVYRELERIKNEE